MDYQGSKIANLEINGDKVEDQVFIDSKVQLPEKHLTDGQNEVTIAFLSKYNDGTKYNGTLGLYRYTD